MSVTIQTLCIILVSKYCIKYICNTVFNLQFFTVLVAHNGFCFDFPILLAEVERRPRQLTVSVFEDNNIHFSDTLQLLRKVCFPSYQTIQQGMIYI